MIRITDTQTGKTITAENGKDAAALVQVALDRKWYAANVAAAK